MNAVRITIAAFLTQVALTPRLWLSGDRSFPLAPVVGAFHLGSVVEALLLLLVVGAALWLLVLPYARSPLALFLAAISLLVLADITRLQPWLFVDLAILLLCRVNERSASRNLPLLLAGLYFWSGLQKLNVAFGQEIFPFIVAPFGLESFAAAHPSLAVVGALFELAIGPLLLRGSTRRFAVVAGILLHLLLLISFGPLGNDWNAVIWPWNLQMIALLWTLRDRERVETIERNWRVAVVVLLFWMLPALNFVGLWDFYLSSALYAGSAPDALFEYVAAGDAPPPGVPDEVRLIDDRRGVEMILIDHWAQIELGVPCYPETRVYRAIGEALCRADWSQVGGRMVVTTRKRFTSEQEIVLIPCASDR